MQKEGRLEGKLGLWKENLINKLMELQGIELNALVVFCRRNHIRSTCTNRRLSGSWCLCSGCVGNFAKYVLSPNVCTKEFLMHIDVKS